MEQQTEKSKKESSVSTMENEVLAFWTRNKTFDQQLEKNKNYPIFSFYDGPPFATGLPHYGHILAGTIKDTITRYQTMTGHHVPRVFGWDTHGLPIEYEIDKQLGIKSREEVLKLGIDKYNEACRAIVLKYRDEWRKTTHRLGRWIDFEHDYKTMDTSFMESVWWVFSQLYQKGLIYHGVKIMPYSMPCGTPLSNFEAKSNYKNVNDPSIIVIFTSQQLSTQLTELLNQQVPAQQAPDQQVPDQQVQQITSVKMLVWTTTPWTLPSNLALCVNPTVEYSLIKQNDQYFVLSSASLERYFPDQTTILNLAKFMGSLLVGTTYQPLYPYFVEQFGKTSFRVVNDNYVTVSDGTGIVHQAPAFGEDDYRVCVKNGIINRTDEPPCPLTTNCDFTPLIEKFKGLNVKKADKEIIKDLNHNGQLFSSKQEAHEYPHCWRTETPLIYRSCPCIFVNVEKIRDRMVEHNQSVHWTPEHIRDGRFGNWLKDAHDWCISRNRFWGTPLPIWKNQDQTEIVVVGSIEELERLANLPKGSVTDLHLHRIGQIKIPSRTKQGEFLHLSGEVADCWFESGAMPYASKHYPFAYPQTNNTPNTENDKFMEEFPGDFIAEGLDQTRGWFYTLMILSTALFDKPAFKNVIVNGLILAEDGEKMSKMKKNYPDPNLVIDKYGSDCLRMYLLSSGVVRADDLKFSEKGVLAVYRNINIYLDNTLSFIRQICDSLIQHKLTMNVKPIIKFQTLEQLKGKVTNILDNWILQELQDLYDYIHQQMGEYHLFGIVKRIEDFVENLSKWYLNLSKRRIKNFAPNQSNTEQNTEQTEVTISVICEVLRYYSLIMAPFAPFYAEHLNQYLFNLKNEHKKENDPEYQSPHLEQIPRQIWEKNEQNLELMKKFKVIVELARGLRTKHNVMFKQSLKMVRIYCRDAKFQNQMEQLEEYLEENLNYQTIEYAQDLDSVVKYAIEVDTKVCGKRLGKNLRKVLNQIDELNQKPDSWKNLNKEDPPNIIVTIDEEQFILNPDEYHLKMVGETSKLTKTQDLDIHQEMVLMIDFENNPEIEKMSETRKLVRILMQLRKIAKLEPKDQVEYYWQDQSAKTDQSTEQDLPEFTPNIIDILQNNDPFLLSLLKQPVQPFDHSKTSIVCQKISYMNQKTPNTITLYLAK